MLLGFDRMASLCFLLDQFLSGKCFVPSQLGSGTLQPLGNCQEDVEFAAKNILALC